MNKNTVPFPNHIVIQSWLRPALTPVLSNGDYEHFRNTLVLVDEALRNSAVESQGLDQALWRT